MDERVRDGFPTFLGQEHRHLTDLLGSLDEEMAAALKRCAWITRKARGDIVVAEGRRIDEIAFVLEGALGVTKRLPDGRVHIVGLLVPGDMFGRLFDGPVAYRIEALSDVRLLCFDRTTFETILRTSPEAERMLLVTMLDEIDAAREWLLLLSGTGVVARLAGFLLVLARRQLVNTGRAARDGLRVTVPLRRIDLAHYLGTRPESLSRAVRQLENEGILSIVRADTFVIDDVSRLIAASEQDFVLPERPDR